MGRLTPVMRRKGRSVGAMRRDAMPQLPAARSVKRTTGASDGISESRLSIAVVSASDESPLLLIVMVSVCGPKMAPTVRTSSSPRTPWVTRRANGRDPAMAGLLDVVPHQRVREELLHAHALHQAIVQRARGVVAVDLDQVVERDHFRDDGDVLPRKDRNGDEGDLDVEIALHLVLQAHPLEIARVVPFSEMHLDL